MRIINGEKLEAVKELEGGGVKYFRSEDIEGAELVAANLSSTVPLTGLDKEVADALIAKGQLDQVVLFSEDFNGFKLTREHAVEVIASSKFAAHRVFEHPEDFDGLKLDADFAIEVLERAQKTKNHNVALQIFTWLSSFKGDINPFVRHVVEKETLLVYNNLSRLKGLDNDIAVELIKRSVVDSDIDALAPFIKPDSEQFPNIDQGVATEYLINVGYDDLKADLDKYPPAELQGDKKDVWEFFADDEVPLRVKQASETSGMIKSHFEALDNWTEEVDQHWRGGDYEEGTGEFYDLRDEHFDYSHAIDRDLSRVLRARMTHAISPKALDRLDTGFYHVNQGVGLRERINRHPELVRDYEEIRKKYEQIELPSIYSGGASQDSLVAKNEEEVYLGNARNAVEKNALSEEEQLLLDIKEGDPSSPETRDKIASWIELYGFERADDDIKRRFRALRESVGGSLTLEYLNRPDLSFHDGVEFFTLDEKEEI